MFSGRMDSFPLFFLDSTTWAVLYLCALGSTESVATSRSKFGPMVGGAYLPRKDFRPSKPPLDIARSQGAMRPRMVTNLDYVSDIRNYE